MYMLGCFWVLFSTVVPIKDVPLRWLVLVMIFQYALVSTTFVEGSCNEEL